MRVGIDDWRVGHFVQNILAHTWLKPQVRFQWHNYVIHMQMYGGYINTNNTFILW